MSYDTITNRDSIYARIGICNFTQNPYMIYDDKNREIRFLKAGNYEFKISLLLSDANSADKIAVKLGEEIISQYDIPINSDSEVIHYIKVNVTNTSDTLYLINISDDKLVLNINKGGCKMENPMLSVTRLQEPVNITEIKNVSNTTITVILNKNFDGTEKVVVFETNNPAKIVPTKIIPDSVEPKPNKRVIMANSPVDTTYNRFSDGVDYTVKIVKGTQKSSQRFVVATNQPTISDAKIDTSIQNTNIIAEPGSNEIETYNLYYKKDEKGSENVSVPVVKPTILNVEQNNSCQGEIIVTFSTKMNMDSGGGSALNSAYYLVSRLDGTIINPHTVALMDAVNKNKVLLTMSENLDGGVHTLSVKDIKDQFGLAMDPQRIIFNIIDTSVPQVVGVTTREKAIVIKFNEVMQNNGQHAINNILNYIVDNLVAKYKLPAATTTALGKDNRCVRITLPEDSTILPMPEGSTYKLNIGYSDLKEVKYVENVSGNIYPLCDPQSIIGPIEVIDITNGVVTVSSAEKLEYKYNGNNEFDNYADINDFIVTLDGEEITPISLNVISEKVIEFTFPSNTFDGGSTEVTIATRQTIFNTKDLYGYPIKSNVKTILPAINGLKATLQAASLVDTAHGSALIRMTFNKSILNFEIQDFKFVINDSDIFVGGVSSARVVDNTDKKVFQIELGAYQTISMKDIIKVMLGVDTNMIRTMDNFGQKIAPFSPIQVVKFVSETINWHKVAGSPLIAGNKINIEFNHPIDPGSLIKDKNFDGRNIPWDGTNLQIPAGNIQFTQDSEVTMSILHNDEFGSIKLQGNSILPGTVATSQSAVLKLIESNKVELQFHSNETINVSIGNVQFVNYIPYMDIQNNTLKNKNKMIYLFKAFEPNSAPSDV